jgi:hypothetical protein
VRGDECKGRDVAEHEGGLQLAEQQRLAPRHVVEYGGVCGGAAHRFERVQAQAVDLDDTGVALRRKPGHWCTEREVEQPPGRGGADDESDVGGDRVQRVDDLDVP